MSHAHPHPFDFEADEMDTSETYEVQAPNLTTGRSHCPTELARIVAANSDWLFAHSDQIVDQDLVLVARTIEEAAAAMTALEWLDGDDDGETWINWSLMPDDSADRASTIRSWSQSHNQTPEGPRE